MTEKQSALYQPLAEQLRPKQIDEVVGQSHLLGPKKPLRVAFESGRPHSMIFWGPPGVGKTTLARLTAQAFDCEWIALSAVFSGVKEIRAAVEMAKNYQEQHRQTILFIDEIHRFNKAQQDGLLPYTESGLFVFIGATTENPSFEVNSALLSRAQVYVLKPLSDDALINLYQRAQTLCLQHLSFEKAAIEAIVHAADGDARRLLNLLEQIDAATAPNIKKQEDGRKVAFEIDERYVTEMIQRTVKRFDKGGDHFYDQISAFHKSVRGSDPDAALYWFCRMVEAGVDPRYLARRILRVAWEDIGLADPRAIQIANDAAQTFERLGTPEGELALAQAVLYLAVAAKSNAGYNAYKQASAFVKKDLSREVPLHLRNAPTSLMKKIGHGKDYRYAHDEPNGYAAGVHYLPEGMDNPRWYQPVKRGLEQKIADKMDFLRKLDEDAYNKNN